MSESVEKLQEDLIKKLEEHIETQSKIIELQDQIIANYDQIVKNSGHIGIEKINHLKLVIDNVKNPAVKKDDEIDFSTGSKFDQTGFKFPDTVTVTDSLVAGDLSGDYSVYLRTIIDKYIKYQLMINQDVFFNDNKSLEDLGCDSLDFLELFMEIENDLTNHFDIEIKDELVEKFRKDVPIREFIDSFIDYFHKLNPKRKK